MKKYSPGLLLLVALCFVATQARAQDETLTIGLNRDLGFSLGGRIQGEFTLWADGPADLSSVSFLLDGQEIGKASASPFRIAFSTDTYPQGQHKFSATGATASGARLTSNTISTEFVGGSDTVAWTIGLIVVLGGGIVLLTLALSLLSGRRRKVAPGSRRSYGLAGGAICPRCGRPFARNPLGLNLISGKLERCPYCGKWGVMRAASPEALAAAEAAETGDSPVTVAAPTPEDTLRKQIEESKYQ